MKELPKKYKSQETEKRLQASWANNRTYNWQDDRPREETFVIDTPPPTVSGLLHMGHIFSYTQADFVARYQRMIGKDVFYPMGFDDNGLPTERLVEKVKKKRAVDYATREEFIEVCTEVSEEARKEFRNLFESVALSVDWNQEYHTISEASRRTSQASFLDLYNKDKAYRKQQPMLWDPVDQTAIAQAEVEDKEVKSHFNNIYFGIEGEDKKITIGTTRPELIPACVAVFYHPDDSRYQHLKGKNAITALFGVSVPIMEDDTVEMEKGTGIMMCCTFGDEADIDKWKRHNLESREILDQYAKLRLLDSNIPFTCDKAILEELDGKKCRTIGREKIIELLQESGELKNREEITHPEPCAERSGAPLEYRTTNQWFVKVIEEQEALKEKAAECNWNPAWMKTRIDQWIDGLSWDWCISRQRYYGVPFPVWYSKRKDEEGKIIPADADQLPVNPLTDLPKGYSADEVTPDLDVMDTWATSSVSPQINSHWMLGDEVEEASTERTSLLVAKGIRPNAEASRPEQGRHKKLFPADLRPQAHEIIRTWAFYTIVKAHLHEDTIPWKNLMISGWCLASDKTKMSKSKGNVVTPVALIEKKGADAVRYWASTSRLGMDTAFSEDVLKIGNKLVNKLWNASKFSAIQLENLQGIPKTAVEDIANGTITEVVDKWIISRLHKAVSKAGKEFEEFEYCKAREHIEDFFWNDFCDNYLEIIKKRAYDEDSINSAAQQSAVYTVYHCLDAVLRLFAPFVPHITEELYSHIFEEKFAEIGSIHGCNTWPNAHNYPIDEESENIGIEVCQILDVVRKLKAEKNVSIKYPLDQIILNMKSANETLEKTFIDLANVTNSAEVKFGIVNNGTKTDNENIEISLTFSENPDKNEKTDAA